MTRFHILALLVIASPAMARIIVDGDTVKLNGATYRLPAQEHPLALSQYRKKKIALHDGKAKWRWRSLTSFIWSELAVHYYSSCQRTEK